MNNSRWTPGTMPPWFFANSLDHGHLFSGKICFIDPNTNETWVVADVNPGLGMQQWRQSAAIIQNAPACLGSLIELFELANHHCSESGEWFTDKPENREVLEKAEAVIENVRAYYEGDWK